MVEVGLPCTQPSGDPWELVWLCKAQVCFFDESMPSFPPKEAACLAKQNLGQWFLGKHGVVVFLFTNSVVTVASGPSNYFGSLFPWTSGMFSRSSREICWFQVQPCPISNELHDNE